MRYRLPTALLAVLWLWSATTSPVSCYAEDVICDPAVNTTDYFCRGWQDGVGQYGSRVRFIARMIGEDYGDDFGSQIVPLGDINGDGRGDFAVFVKNKCEWRIFLGDTLISRTPYMIWPRGDAPYPCSPFPGNLEVIPDVIGNGQLTLVRSFAGYPETRWFYSLGTAFDTIPEFKLTDTAFVFAATFAGGLDLNGDGQPDLVVGDPNYYQASPQRSGRIYVYWGGSVLDTVPDLIFTDTSWSGQNQPYPPGGSIAVLPSLNADSYPDLVLGRASNSAVLNPPGRVDIFFGGPAMDTVRDLVLFSLDTAYIQTCLHYPAGNFGWIVRDVGDVNQDGFEDLLVTEGCGYAFVYYGGPSFDTEFDLRTQGGSQAMGFGDINGDGHSDYGTAVPSNELTPGWVYVRFAQPAPTGAVDWTIVGDDWFYTGPSFGRETTWLGDIDGDGFDDFAVGMRTAQVEEQNEGGIYVFAGYDPDIYSGIFDEPEIPLPSDMRLVEHIAPNPFNTGTTIRLSQAFTSGQVVIYDILGRPVRRFAINRSHQSGEIVWDSRNDTGRPVSSGLYFARVTSGRQSETHKLMLLK